MRLKQNIQFTGCCRQTAVNKNGNILHPSERETGMITKNRQSNETITEMARKAFPQKTVIKIKELTEGMCNVTYHVVFDDSSESILKIAAENTAGNTSNEVNLMVAEVRAMRLVSGKCSCKVAEVQYYDCSRTVCSGDYFFMEKLPGENYAFLKDRLPESVIRELNREIGRISRELTAITNAQFGFLGAERRYNTLFEFVKTMLTNLLSDARKKGVDIGYDAKRLIEELDSEKDIFDEVRSATLVHWDMWEGNIFVSRNHVSGIIDWERSLWGEAFMDDRFRKHNRNDDFLEGFGLSTFSESDLKRIRWYDVILYLTMMIEVFYREYEDQGQYRWAKDMLLNVLQ